MIEHNETRAETAECLCQACDAFGIAQKTIRVQELRITHLKLLLIEQTPLTRESLKVLADELEDAIKDTQ